MQCSSFGAFLDVFIDNLTRGTLWVWSTPAPFGVLPVILETTVFTCTHTVRPGIGSLKRNTHLCNCFPCKSCCDIIPGWSSLEDRLFQSSTQVAALITMLNICFARCCHPHLTQLHLMIMLAGGCKASWLMASKRPQELWPL